MAKIEFIQEGDEKMPSSIESIEVRLWGVAGKRSQIFYIGSGCNFSADGNIWVEIIYSVGGAQLFYTRNFFQNAGPDDQWEAREAQLDEIIAEGEGAIGFGDILPQTNISLKVSTSRRADGKPSSVSYDLTISIDVGAVFGSMSPGCRTIDIHIPHARAEDAARFMRELIHEFANSIQGKHPDPASLTPGSSSWPFALQLNQLAYNTVSDSYHEKYFDNPLLQQAFDGWLAQIPDGGHILDAGCGHGDPVIARLLEKGFQVTGTDLSPAMLHIAKERYPQATFLLQPTPQLAYDAEFDGACSFSSTLYLDPVDLFHSIYRLHRALKPGGLLFLYGYDTHPGWRGEPYGIDLGHYMWSWTYSMEETAQALEEHGYFEVLGAHNVTTEEELEKRRAHVIEQQLLARKAAEKMAADDAPMDQSNFQMPEFPDPLETLAYHYVVIARRREQVTSG